MEVVDAFSNRKMIFIFACSDTDVQRGNKGGIWHRCLEPIAIAQTAYPEDDELQRDLAEVR